MKPQTGFTLLEVMVVLAVAAVLLAIVLPTFGTAMAAARASQARAALLETVVDSVRYAGIRGVEVVACPEAAGGGCADSWDWSGGWTAFADLDGDRIRDANEARVTAHGALPPKVRLQSTTGRRRLVFQPNGGNAGSNVTFTLCDTRGVAQARSLILSNPGNLREAPASPESAAACLAGL